MVRVRSFDDGERRRRRGAGQRPGHPAEIIAAHLRLVLHDQAARDGHRPGAADLAGHRAVDGRRDHRRQPARRRRDVPRAPARAWRRPSSRSRRRRPRCRRAGSRAGASWPSTTRPCCSRRIGACWATCTTSDTALGGARGAARARPRRRFDVDPVRSADARDVGHGAPRRGAPALPGAGRAVHLRHRRRVLERRQALPRGVGVRRDQEAVPRRGAAGADRAQERGRRLRASERAPADPPWLSAEPWRLDVRARKLVVAALVRDGTAGAS